MSPSFPPGFEGCIWDLTVLISDNCLSIYFTINIIMWAGAAIKVITSPEDHIQLAVKLPRLKKTLKLVLPITSDTYY